MLEDLRKQGIDGQAHRLYLGMRRREGRRRMLLSYNWEFGFQPFPDLPGLPEVLGHRRQVSARQVLDFRNTLTYFCAVWWGRRCRLPVSRRFRAAGGGELRSAARAEHRQQVLGWSSSPLPLPPGG